MTAKLTISKIRKALWKLISGVFFYGSCFLLILLLLIQIKPLQTFFAQKVLASLSEKTGHTISIDRIRISWLDRATMSDILILDLQQDTLLYAESMTVNYKIKKLLEGNYLNVEEINAQNTLLHLIKHDSVSKLNLTEFLNSLKGDTSSQKKGRSISIEQVEFVDLEFKMEDRSKIPKKDQIDFGNLDFDIPDLNMGMFELKKDTVIGSIFKFEGRDRNSGFEIESLYSKFRLTGQSLSIDDLDLNTPTSHLTDSLEFFYNGLDDFGYFIDSVSFVLHLNNSIVSHTDLQILSGSDKIESDIELDGIFWGTVGDFNIEDARVGFGETYFRGGVSCFGLPDLSKTFILADILDSHLDPNDLTPYVGNVSENLHRMGRIDFNGSFAGFATDFVARGDFYTDQGSIHSDINIKIPEDPTMMTYKGNLRLKEVNVGAFLKNDIVQNINMSATIEGQGISKENADFNLNAAIYNSGLKGYVYDSILINGHFAKNFFDGTLSVEDPNCQLHGAAEIDFRTEAERLDLLILLDKINTKRLHFTKDTINASGRIEFVVDNLDLDNFTSKLTIDSSLLSINGKQLVLDSIRFDALLEDSIRTLIYSMPGLYGQIKGKFDITNVIKDIPVMASGYASKLKMRQDTGLAIGSGERYRLDLKLEVGNLNPYLDSLDLPFVLKSDAIVDGTFRQSAFSTISLYAQTDSIEYNGFNFKRSEFELNGSKSNSSNAVLTSFLFTSQEVLIPGVSPVEELLLEGIWSNQNINFTTQLRQPETVSDLRLESQFTIAEDSISLKMLPSDIQILNDRWDFNPENEVVFKPSETTINNLEIHDQTESLRVDGVIGDTTETFIDVAAKDLNMNKTDLFTRTEINGLLSGDFRVFRENTLDAFKFDGGFMLQALQYEDILVGDVRGSSNWDPVMERIYSNVEVNRENFNEIEVNGFYYPKRETDQLDIDVKFDQAELDIARPLLKDNFSELGGYSNGALKITGQLGSPKIVGDANVIGGNITVDYLNTHYTFDGNISFKPGAIVLDTIYLTDRKGSNARVTGKIAHRSFSNFVTDFTIASNNFEYLNTTSLDNDLYYGTAYATGNINVSGPLNDLYIKAENMRTEPDTRLYIPVSESTSSGVEEYIQFVDLTDTLTQVINEDIGIKGLTLEFDIDVTPDAYCELIFDIKTGDIIKGRGRGNLKLRMNTDGEFNMFGPLEMTEGTYNLTLMGVISREFDVTAGSRITWYGDPYNATLDLEATNMQRASFEELKNPDERNQDELTDQIPLLVVLGLNGGMLSPDIGFDIRPQNEGDVNSQNEALLAEIRNDEQELRRQVISLLFLKRFSPKQSFTLSGGGGGLGSTVSQVLSRNISYLVSQVDENLEVEVDLADLDQEAFNSFQLRFAYTFLGGRLKVTRGGSFGNQQDQNQNVLNDIVGDWSVEYSLTKDGRLRAKVFRNSNQRLLTNDGQQSQETGVSLRFVHSFNDLRDLLTSARQEGIRRREDEESSNQSNAVPLDTGTQ